MVKCGFCQMAIENSVTGPLFQKNNTVVHQNCMFFSSGICEKKKRDNDELMGFAEEDVVAEMKRGASLKCHLCKKTGATVGCELKKCKRSYHYPCAFEDNVEINADTFAVYCQLHKEESPQRSGVISTPTKKTNRNKDSDKEIPIKRKRLSASGGAVKGGENTHTPYRRRLDSENGDVNHLNSEQAPLDADLEDSENSELMVVAEWNTSRNEEEEPQPSTSGTQAVQHAEADNFTDSEANSESLLPPFTTHQQVESGQPVQSDRTCASPSSPEPAALFWERCLEAGVAESMFSTFISRMMSSSEKIVFKSASEEDYEFCLRVLRASGMLLQICAQKKQDLHKSFETLQKEMDALEKVEASVTNASNNPHVPRA